MSGNKMTLQKTVAGLSTAAQKSKEFVGELTQPNAAPLLSLTATAAFTGLLVVNALDQGRLATWLTLLCTLGSAGLTVSHYGKERSIEGLKWGLNSAVQLGQSSISFFKAGKTSVDAPVEQDSELNAKQNVTINYGKSA